MIRELKCDLRFSIIIQKSAYTYFMERVKVCRSYQKPIDFRSLIDENHSNIYVEIGALFLKYRLKNEALLPTLH